MESCKCSTQIRSLGVRRHGAQILHDVNLDVHHGEIMALIGQNGAGKSTLLKALLGRLPYTGTITFHSADGSVLKDPHIGYVPQNLVFDRATPVTVLDMLSANLTRFPVWLGHRKEQKDLAAKMLQKVGGSPDLLPKRLGALSGGELQRVLLAFALTPMPDLLLLDEPVSAVDRRGIELFYDLVTHMRKQHAMPIILVSHDLSHVLKYATRAALINHTVIVSGPVDQVMRTDAVQETFGLKLAGGSGH
ncbi:MAG: metal ABC transporter ATP-binding protein [Oscillospiraceae bacterium]|jgi:zinc transport system ATP-binding protein|nr:metal ABC transporter ATP-binding protein [Oscillospiraceae bacterium]MDD3260836.1 metal ABC transporter ATP-binding protein [Oscillospiraceae bacterium]